MPQDKQEVLMERASTRAKRTVDFIIVAGSKNGTENKRNIKKNDKEKFDGNKKEEHRS